MNTIRRALLLALCGLHCARPVAPPRPLAVDASFTREPLDADCVTMARRTDGSRDLQMEVRRAQEPALALYASDERWVLHFYTVPPPRAGLDHHEVRDLTLICGSERIALQSLACRGGHGLRLYVDPIPLAGRAVGTRDATCRLAVVIDGLRLEDPGPILVRPGLRAWFEDPKVEQAEDNAS